MPLYQAMYSTMARRAPARAGQGCRSSNSPLIDLKNDSARALSQLAYFADTRVIGRVDAQVKLAQPVVVACSQVGLPGANGMTRGGARSASA